MTRIALLLLVFCLPFAAQAQPLPPVAQQLLAEVQTLGLTPLQKQQLMAIAIDARSRQQALRAEQQALGDAAYTELAAGSADLIALAAQQQALTDRRIAAARVTRDALLDFYAGLGAAQQVQVQGWLAGAIERLDALRALAGTFATASHL
jgi:hypothetical protein